MITNVLITYATCTGSTRDVAEAIAKTLQTKGLQTSVCPVGQVKNPATYDMVIIGSPLQGKQWLPEAMNFIRMHQTVLRQKRIATFLTCITLAMKNGESYRSNIMASLAPVHALVKPVSEGGFAGMLDVAKIPSAADRFKFRMSVMMGVWQEGDHRNWEQITAWADALPLL